MLKGWVIVFLGFWLGTANVHAALDENCQTNCSEDYFSQLANLYTHGTIPTADSLTGWFSGRCYDYKYKSTPENLLLIGWKEPAGGNNGPLFPGHGDFKSIWATTSAQANYFDNLTSSVESVINRIFYSNKDDALGSCLENDALLTPNQDGLKFYVRQSGAYAIAQKLYNGQLLAYCYTFKKIR